MENKYYNLQFYPFGLSLPVKDYLSEDQFINLENKQKEELEKLELDSKKEFEENNCLEDREKNLILKVKCMKKLQEILNYGT